MQIQIQNLTKQFKGQLVLSGINQTFEQKHVYGIVGENGSGKSVFLKILLGLIRPTQGTIMISSEGENIEPEIAAVLDGNNLYPDLSAKENLKYLAKFKKVIEDDEIDKAIKVVGLNPLDETPIKKYSVGMNKRLLIAQAIMEPVNILILDEPTNGLDEKGIEILYRIVEEQKQKGTIILITSHRCEDIRFLCDTVFRMREGKLWQEEV